MSVSPLLRSEAVCGMPYLTCYLEVAPPQSAVETACWTLSELLDCRYRIINSRLCVTLWDMFG